jgi:hypothetical protein
MPYQQASRPQTVLTSHELTLLVSNQLPGQAHEEEKDFSLDSLVVPQATESSQSSNASHEHQSHAATHFPKSAQDKEQESRPILSSLLITQRPETSNFKDREYLKPALEDECIKTKVLSATPFRVPNTKKRGKIYRTGQRKNKQEVDSHTIHDVGNKIGGRRGISVRRRRNASRHGKISGFILLLMLCIMSVAQALTDCHIMIDWLPMMFNGTGTSCCEQSGITCVSGRITQMYVALKLTYF